MPASLRPLNADDVRDPRIIGWHTDPAGYRLLVQEPMTEADATASLRAWHEAWARDGISYWIAEENGTPVGIGGVRRLTFHGRDHFNLYYRLDPAARGRGLGTQLARAGLEYVVEHHPELPVTARVAPANVPSIRVAERSGVLNLGPWRAPDDGEVTPLLFQSPRVLFHAPSESEQAAMVDLWCAVNDAGGAVGFEPGAERASVRAALEEHVERDEPVRLVAPTLDTFDDPSRNADLLGFAFLRRSDDPKLRHRASLYRVMTAPQHRGHWFGQLLMAALHGRARRQGVEIAEISYRGGTGLERFYTGCGYRECGRVVGGLRLSDGDRDDVAMMRRL